MRTKSLEEEILVGVGNMIACSQAGECGEMAIEVELELELLEQIRAEEKVDVELARLGLTRDEAHLVVRHDRHRNVVDEDTAQLHSRQQSERDLKVQNDKIVTENGKRSIVGVVKNTSTTITYHGPTVSFDLTDTGIDGYNKFIPYYFYPETTYNVALSQSAFRTKISVGSNPWAPRPRTKNIAEICERYGGGGHAVVGAVSLAPGAVELGRRYVKEIIEELQFED
jgi:hypothetical protein